MRFRSIVIAAVVLVLAAAGPLAAYQMADLARGEAAQQEIEREDSLAVDSSIRQKLVSDDDHNPTKYNDTIDVDYNGTDWTEGDEYEYYPEFGEIEFLVDKSDPANITYTYFVPANQAADDRLQSLTISTGLALRLGGGLSFVVLFLFIAGFVRQRMGTGRTSRTGR